MFPRPFALQWKSRRGALAALAWVAACQSGQPRSSPNDSNAPTDSASRVAAVTPSPRTDSAPSMPGPPPPKANEQMQAVLDQLRALGGKPIETLTPPEARRQPTPTDAVKALLAKSGKPTTPPPGVTTVDRSIPGPGGELPVRIYTPEGGTAPFPVIVYFHGGGWVIANKDVYDAGPRALSRLANAVVVSVDYRLAPEHKFPAAHDDAVAAYRWALANAASIRGDSARVALAGESAGGNMAVATAMAARDQSMRQPAHALAVYPVAESDTTTPSYRENANAKPLNPRMITWFLMHYTRSPRDAQDPRLNLVGGRLAGLPPTTIITAQIDPLRSGGQNLADKLKSAGVDVAMKHYDAVAHEFFGMDAVLTEARDAQAFAAARLKASFSR